MHVIEKLTLVEAIPQSWPASKAEGFAGGVSINWISPSRSVALDTMIFDATVIDSRSDNGRRHAVSSLCRFVHRVFNEQRNTKDRTVKDLALAPKVAARPR